MKWLRTVEDPGDGDERSVLLGWLAFHRAVLATKCAGRSVRWNLQKLVGEYARHNGHADLLRERIDGATGES